MSGRRPTEGSAFLPASIRGDSMMNKTFGPSNSAKRAAGRRRDVLDPGTSSPLSQSDSLRSIARQAAAAETRREQKQQQQQQRQITTTRDSSAKPSQQRRRSSSFQLQRFPKDLSVIDLRQMPAASNMTSASSRSSRSPIHEKMSLPSPCTAPQSPSSSFSPLSIADSVLTRLQCEISEIKKKFPITSVSQFTMTSVPAAVGDDKIVVDDSNQQLQQSAPLSSQLAAERDQHRQRLDELWKCAQGWKSRCKATEDAFRRLAHDVVFSDLMRIAETEARFRLEVAAEQQREWNAEIMAPLMRLMNRELAKWAGHKCTATLLSTSLHTVGANGGGAASCSTTTTTTMTLSAAASAGFKVRDSDLLRALRAAETRLAQLGEPATPVVGADRAAGSFQFVR